MRKTIQELGVPGCEKVDQPGLSFRVKPGYVFGCDRPKHGHHAKRKHGHDKHNDKHGHGSKFGRGPFGLKHGPGSRLARYIYDHLESQWERDQSCSNAGPRANCPKPSHGRRVHFFGDDTERTAPVDLTGSSSSDSSPGTDAKMLDAEFRFQYLNQTRAQKRDAEFQDFEEYLLYRSDEESGSDVEVVDATEGKLKILLFALWIFMFQPCLNGVFY